MKWLCNSVSVLSSRADMCTSVAGNRFYIILSVMYNANVKQKMINRKWPIAFSTLFTTERIDNIAKLCNKIYSNYLMHYSISSTVVKFEMINGEQRIVVMSCFTIDKFFRRIRLITVIWNMGRWSIAPSCWYM